MLHYYESIRQQAEADRAHKHPSASRPNCPPARGGIAAGNDKAQAPALADQLAIRRLVELGLKVKEK